MMKRLGFFLAVIAASASIPSWSTAVHADAGTPGPTGSPGQLTEVRYGPFVLGPAGAGGDLDPANVVLPDVAKPCENCFILGAEPNLV